MGQGTLEGAWQLGANPGVKDSNFESSQADRGAACHSCRWADGYIDGPVRSGREDGGLRGRSEYVPSKESGPMLLMALL